MLLKLRQINCPGKVLNGLAFPPLVIHEWSCPTKELLHYADPIQQNHRAVPPTRRPRRTRLRPQPAPPPTPGPRTAGGPTPRAALGNRSPVQLAPGRAVSLAGRGLRSPPHPPSALRLPGPARQGPLSHRSTG